MTLLGFIYKVTNDVNGKMYVGKTEDYPPENRWKEHLQDYKRRKNEKRPFYDAIKRYGPEHFHFEVIEETEDVCEREIYWIDKLRTYVGFEDCNGYNGTLGGDGKKYLNLDEDEVIQYHLTEARQVVGYTAEHFNVDGKTIKIILRKHNIGWLSNKETKELIHFEEHGFIYQLDQERHLINKWKTVESIAKENNALNTKSIVQAMNGMDRKDKSRIHFYKGYYWYTDSNLTDEIKQLNGL